MKRLEVSFQFLLTSGLETSAWSDSKTPEEVVLTCWKLGSTQSGNLREKTICLTKKKTRTFKGKLMFLGKSVTTGC